MRQKNSYFWPTEPPNYPEDLNLMQAAWRTLTRRQQQAFAKIIGDNPKFCRLVKKNVITCRYLLFGASAEDWADAFLRVLKKPKNLTRGV